MMLVLSMPLSRRLFDAEHVSAGSVLMTRVSSSYFGCVSSRYCYYCRSLWRPDSFDYVPVCTMAN